jgi:RNA polymerase sigma-70 factor (ECF subfamily)
VSLSESCDGYCQFEVEDKTANPEQLCELSQRYNHLANEIQRLRPQLRIPLEFQVAEEYAVKDIADTLNISVAAVKARLYRARVRLARRISKQ